MLTILNYINYNINLKFFFKYKYSKLEFLTNELNDVLLNYN